MPTIKAASTPSRNVTMNACSINGWLTACCNSVSTGLLSVIIQDWCELQASEEGPGLLQMREKLFFSLELRRVHAPPRAFQFHRMPEVQHLVVHDVLDYMPRYARMIQNTGHNDGVMRGIIMSQQITRRIAAPGQFRLTH